MSTRHDTHPVGESPWDDLSDVDSSAWADTAPAPGSVWDDDALAPASVWEDDVSVPASVWDDDVSAPASVWDDGGVNPADAWGDAASAPVPDGGNGTRAPVREVRAASRAAAVPGTTTHRAPGAGAAGSRRRASAASPQAAPVASPQGAPAASPEVAAVAARLAEIVGRSDRGRRASRAAAEAEVPDVGVPDASVLDADADAGADAGADVRSAGVPDAGAPGAPDRARRPSRRAPGGRRGTPATEPPGSGAAAADREPDPESVARTIALRQLTAAPRSRAQLAEAMAKRDVPEDVADRVLDRFTEVGLVDDTAYAEMLVRSRHAERGMSRRALALELRRKGVADEVARGALEQVDDADEEEAARALARKKLRATRGLDREVRLRRAYGALGRRGYGGSLVSRVVREELDAEGAAEDGDVDRG